MEKGDFPLAPILLGFLGSGAVAWLAWRAGALSLSGALAAVAVGTALFGAGSPAWFGTLLVFFFTSTAWSKWKKHKKKSAESGYEKGSRRDAGQVLANGGLAALLCLLWAFVPDAVWWYGFVGVMASVTADTWATEIGALSRREPISIVGLRRVPRGTSGAVSPLGSLAALSGALAIGLSAWAFVALEQSAVPILESWASGGSAASEATGVRGAVLDVAGRWALVSGGWAVVWAALVGGIAGAFADSVIGATVQRMNRCTVCGRLVEQSSHCGRKTERARGFRWMNNDAVNLISSVIGGLLAMAVGLWIA